MALFNAINQKALRVRETGQRQALEGGIDSPPLLAITHPFGARCARPALLTQLVERRARLMTSLTAINQKAPRVRGFLVYGGEGGIRTLDTFPYTPLAGERLRPLGHLTGNSNCLQGYPRPSPLFLLRQDEG